jgi:hypothetical protein
MTGPVSRHSAGSRVGRWFSFGLQTLITGFTRRGKRLFKFWISLVCR